MGGGGRMMDEMEFVRRLKNSGLERDEERRLYAAALLNEALKEQGSRVTVVGGSIVALFTAGHYTTADLDFVAKNRTAASDTSMKPLA